MAPATAGATTPTRPAASRPAPEGTTEPEPGRRGAGGNSPSVGRPSSAAGAGDIERAPQELNFQQRGSGGGRGGGSRRVGPVRASPRRQPLERTFLELELRQARDVGAPRPADVEVTQQENRRGVGRGRRSCGLCRWTRRL